MTAATVHYYRDRRLRNPDNWTYSNIPAMTLLDRGYTGHEHLEAFRLINMNGRMYDPLTGRMLSADPYVQDIAGTQGFNRYSYCLNNPLLYTDPSGNFPVALMFMKEYLFIGGFIADYCTNLMNGVDNPAKTAYNNITNGINGMSNCLQFPVYRNDNFVLTAGLDPFAFGVSANAYYNTGNWTFNTGAGYGLLNKGFSGVGAMYSTEDWAFGTGVGYGKNHWGWNASTSFKGYGLSYGQTYYGGKDAQTTGTAAIFGPGWSFRLENDFLAKNGDRWRTSAWELTAGDWSLGSSIYTNDPKGMESGVDENGTDLLGNLNKHGNGAWKLGQVYSSPLWIGYRNGNQITRFGYSHKMIQDRTQNWVHRNGFFYLPFGRQNYYNLYDDFRYGWYGYSGYYNPFSFYH